MQKKKKQPVSSRDAEVVIVFGKNGTGKSYLVRKMVEATNDRVLVVTYAGMPKVWRDIPVIDADNPADWNWKSGIRQVIAAKYDHPTKENKTLLFEYIFKHFREGTVIFDDSREYITSNRLTDYPYLKKILSSFRHVELDVIFVMHGPGDVPRQIWNYVSTTFVFHTNATITKADVRSAIAEEIIDAQQKIKPEYIKRKARNDGSHYGLFIKIKS